MKETPYSAYITIRKKLIIPVTREGSEVVANDTIDIDANLKSVEKENSRLRERNLDVEREHALLNIEFEKLEMKFGELKDINDKLNDKNEELSEEYTKLVKHNTTIDNDLKKETIKFDQYKNEELKKAKDKSDLVDILEATLENKKIEVNDLKKQLSKAFIEIEDLKGSLEDIQKYQFKCQNCEYEASTEVLLEEHMKKHEPICKFCNLTFKTSETLKKHTCKLNIENAEFKQFYLKNWILTHGCTALFNKNQMKEIAILHNETCFTHICPCRELPGWHCLGDTMYDADGILHAPRKDFIDNGVVNWSELHKELED